jgi:hypothetical protein
MTTAMRMAIKKATVLTRVSMRFPILPLDKKACRLGCEAGGIGFKPDLHLQ